VREFSAVYLKMLPASRTVGQASKSLSSIGYLYSSGPEWPARMKRSAAARPNSVFSAKADAGGRVLDPHRGGKGIF